MLKSYYKMRYGIDFKNGLDPVAALRFENGYLAIAAVLISCSIIIFLVYYQTKVTQSMKLYQENSWQKPNEYKTPYQLMIEDFKNLTKVEGNEKSR